MRFLSAAVLAIALSGCQHIGQGLDYVDQKIIPAGTVIVKSQTLIQLSEEFKDGYGQFRELMSSKKGDISEEDFSILLEADRELTQLGSYVDGLLSTENSLGNVLLNSDQILDIVSPVDSAVKLGKQVLENNPQIFSDSERRQYVILDETWERAVDEVISIDDTLSESETAGRLMRVGRLGLQLVSLAPLLI